MKRKKVSGSETKESLDRRKASRGYRLRRLDGNFKLPYFILSHDVNKQRHCNTAEFS